MNVEYTWSYIKPRGDWVEYPSAERSPIQFNCPACGMTCAPLVGIEEVEPNTPQGDGEWSSPWGKAEGKVLVLVQHCEGGCGPVGVAYWEHKGSTTAAPVVQTVLRTSRYRNRA